MEHKVRTVAPEEIMEHLPQLLTETEALPLVISGNSMAPFLVHGRDTVYLSKVEKPLKRGDMILYRRENGQYILHRIYRAYNGRYDLVGDGQWGIEPEICTQQVLAVVTAVRRKGKLLRPGAFWWEFFAKTWLWMRPVRAKAQAIYRFLTPWRNQK